MRHILTTANQHQIKIKVSPKLTIILLLWVLSAHWSSLPGLSEQRQAALYWVRKSTKKLQICSRASHQRSARECFAIWWTEKKQLKQTRSYTDSRDILNAFVCLCWGNSGRKIQTQSAVCSFTFTQHNRHWELRVKKTRDRPRSSSWLAAQENNVYK